MRIELGDDVQPKVATLHVPLRGSLLQQIEDLARREDRSKASVARRLLIKALSAQGENTGGLQS